MHQRLVEAGGRCRPGRQLLRPPAERLEICQADRPARPAQQRGDVGIGGDVVEHPQRRDDGCDLGQAEQAAEANDLHGDVPVAQRLEDGREQGVAPDEDRLVGPGHAGRVAADDRLDQPVDLVAERVERGGGHRTGGRGLRGGERDPLLARLSPQPGRQRIADVENALAAAAVDAEREPRGR